MHKLLKIIQSVAHIKRTGTLIKYAAWYDWIHVLGRDVNLVESVRSAIFYGLRNKLAQLVFTIGAHLIQIKPLTCFYFVLTSIDLITQWLEAANNVEIRTTVRSWIIVLLTKSDDGREFLMGFFELNN